MSGVEMLALQSRPRSGKIHSPGDSPYCDPPPGPLEFSRL
jgi:hypothetical protein